MQALFSYLYFPSGAQSPVKTQNLPFLCESLQTLVLHLSLSLFPALAQLSALKIAAWSNTSRAMT